ncbi:MAG TPA: bifunctional 4-hydroxy-2-oxoglutarate aldolase/2-dehydro-3-deoxy-phosphogluconate aldolase [Bryobacteraceae bacterium]|nr:bifunctional 4-hydroxy-2-oxoglutarate aldolase/2-dehydro-3-deoxy-phosphogluconate aldolase [Bryobacteraceae bacterium]
MTNTEVCARLEEIGIIPAIRVSSQQDAVFAAEAIAAAGIPIVELTMTVPGAIDVIAGLRRQDPDVIVGAGTVHDIDIARRCLDAGAQFITSTGLDLAIVEFALRAEVLVFPGVLTPTEILAARKAGCDLVKIFPCSQLGGASYLRALRAPFPKMRFIASGGVNQTTAAEFILAGASALGVGGELIPHKAIERRERNWIRELARRFMSLVAEARQQPAA